MPSIPYAQQNRGDAALTSFDSQRQWKNDQRCWPNNYEGRKSTLNSIQQPQQKHAAVRDRSKSMACTFQCEWRKNIPAKRILPVATTIGSERSGRGTLIGRRGGRRPERGRQRAKKKLCERHTRPLLMYLVLFYTMYIIVWVW